MSRTSLLYACVMLLLVGACAEFPAGLPTESAGVQAAKGRPTSCSAYAPLSATLADAPGDGLVSDGGGAYVEGVDGVESHINGPTGHLSIWTTQSPRYLVANTGSGPVTIDRAYTNSHSNTCGLQLSTLPTSSFAAFEGEERQGGTGSTVSKVVYGKTCSGAADNASRVTIAWDGTTTITITAPSGRWCRLTGKGKNPWTDAGPVSGFQMTMVP